MDSITNNIDFQCLTAIVTDETLDAKIKALRICQSRLIDLQEETEEVEGAIEELQRASIADAHSILRDDAGIAFDYATEAWT